MRFFLFLLSLLVLNLTATADSEKLPPEASDLLGKLSDWEQEEKKLFDAKIQEKREQVAVLLDRILENSTKAGDLDGALAIREALKSLRTGESVEPIAKPTPPSTATPVQGIWKWLFGQSIRFDEDGQGAVITPANHEWQMQWKEGSDGSIEVNYSENSASITFDAVRKSGKVTATVNDKHQEFVTVPLE